ncbi:hypothetical protein H3S93_06790 [Bifidobacterium sp. W8109]|nr:MULTISPECIES: hypothetical protein [Bifidobacterium]AFU71306.1 hypothetical protein BAST_0719 [Bifidobacterium asteroides PRL2011]MBH9972012.1 hypothetical protein [Bifidobacterium asteroides]MBH9979490.1 hypothetical protein [Bifidobacterium asteroides]MBH9984639.1 hypothetical protein [Bifidobacterium asteroides]MBI0073658.1 hypothetical protein [Bifidobacterium sp. W8110]
MTEYMDLTPTWDRDRTIEDSTGQGFGGWWPSTCMQVPLGLGNINLTVRTVNFVRPADAAGHKGLSGDLKRILVNLCALASRVFDVLRGRLPMKSLDRVLNRVCMERLAVLARLMRDQHLGMVRTADHVGMAYLPLIPKLVELYCVDRDRYETTIGFLVGERTVLTNLIVARSGSRWVCVRFDMG